MVLGLQSSATDSTVGGEGVLLVEMVPITEVGSEILTRVGHGAFDREEGE